MIATATKNLFTDAFRSSPEEIVESFDNEYRQMKSLAVGFAVIFVATIAWSLLKSAFTGMPSELRVVETATLGMLEMIMYTAFVAIIAVYSKAAIGAWRTL